MAQAVVLFAHSAFGTSYALHPFCLLLLTKLTTPTLLRTAPGGAGLLANKSLFFLSASTTSMGPDHSSTHEKTTQHLYPDTTRTSPLCGPESVPSNLSRRPERNCAKSMANTTVHPLTFCLHFSILLYSWASCVHLWTLAFSSILGDKQPKSN